MVSTRQNSFEPTRVRHTILCLLALVGVLFLIAGCGGGGGGGKEPGRSTGKTTTGGGEKTRTGPRGTRPGPPPKPGTVLKDFNVTVASKTSAKITLTLGKAADLALQVRKMVGGKPQKVGRVPFGPKPAGKVTINWNLKVANKPLTPGTYQLQMRGKGGAGKSVPKTVKIP
jgi:hypothetical protein